MIVFSLNVSFLFRKCYYPGALALYSAMDRHYASKYGHYLDVLKGFNFTSQEFQSNRRSLLSKELEMALDGQSVGKQNRSSPLVIPQVQLPGQRPIVDCTPTLGAASPFTAQSPEYTMLGDLLTPRDTLTYPSRDLRLMTSLKSKNVHQEGSNLVLLSARPESYKGLTESESYRKYFQPLVMRGDLATSPTMLLGSLDSGARALIKLLFGTSTVPNHPKSKTAKAALYQTLAAKKLSRFREYAAIYPEATFVYVGDNGQGDVLCAEIMTSSVEDNEPCKSQVLATLIHRVTNPLSTLSLYRKEDTTLEDLHREWNRRGIIFNRTHVGMAKSALDLGLIDTADAQRVVSSAITEFKRISSRYSGRHVGGHLDRAARDLNEDIKMLNSVLPENDRIQELVTINKGSLRESPEIELPTVSLRSNEFGAME